MPNTPIEQSPEQSELSSVQSSKPSSVQSSMPSREPSPEQSPSATAAASHAIVEEDLAEPSAFYVLPANPKVKTSYCCDVCGPSRPLCHPDTGRYCFRAHIELGMPPKRKWLANNVWGWVRTDGRHNQHRVHRTGERRGGHQGTLMP